MKKCLYCKRELDKDYLVNKIGEFYRVATFIVCM